MKMSSKECDTCCSLLTKTNIVVQCPYCKLSGCRKCVKKYILSSQKNPNCMGCHREWNLDYCRQTLSDEFVDGRYKEHHLNIVLSKEKSLLPLTQIKIEKRIKLEKIALKIAKLKKQIDELKDEAKKIRGNKTNDAKRVFTKKCPSKTCNGFLSTRWICGLCDCRVCNKCHEIKKMNNDEEKEHVCKKENLETVKMLDSETKTCPKCAASIFKIEGCDQMFCIQCHTPFSWNTGKAIISGPIHNPHYFEWQRKLNGGVLPRQTGDVPCGGLPQFAQVIKGRDMKESDYLTEKYQSVVHIQQTILVNNNIMENEDLRERFLTNEIDEDKWKKMLALREKREQKMKEYKDIMNMFVTAMIDIFQMPKIDIKQIEKLREYTNIQIDLLRKKYKSKALKTMPNV